MGFEYEVDVNGVRKDSLDTELKSLLPSHYSYAWEYIDCVSGYEIKSSVAPLRTLKREVAQIKAFFRHEEKNTNRNNGGIHVNISRNDYTNQHRKKVFKFLHHQANYNFLQNLSGRSQNSFSSNSYQNGGDFCDYYCGIITTRKTYAYEMRMFKAQEYLLIPALEFCHALFDLAPKVESITIDNLKEHIARWQRYSHINALIEEKGL